MPGSTTAPATDGDGGDVLGDSVRNASEVSDGATWLGRVLSTLGLAVLFGSFVLIVVAWPEGPEYILAVRFLRSVWLLTFAGTLLYVVALSAAVNDEVARRRAEPGDVARPARRRVAGARRARSSRAGAGDRVGSCCGPSD